MRMYGKVMLSFYENNAKQSNCSEKQNFCQKIFLSEKWPGRVLDRFCEIHHPYITQSTNPTYYTKLCRIQCAAFHICAAYICTHHKISGEERHCICSDLNNLSRLECLLTASGSGCRTWEGAGMPGRLVVCYFCILAACCCWYTSYT